MVGPVVIRARDFLRKNVYCTSILSVLAISAPLALAQQEDCNSNGVADSQDIADGTSADCNFDSIPDDCQARNRLIGGGREGFLLELDVSGGPARVLHDVGVRGHLAVRGVAAGAGAGVVYGVDSVTGFLIAIDVETSAVSTIGPTGFTGLLGLTYDANADVFYACRSDFDEGAAIIEIDPSTGNGRVKRGLDEVALDAIVYDPAMGTLLGADRYGGLFRVDLQSSAITQASDILGGSGIAFDEARGLFIIARGGQLLGIDPALRVVAVWSFPYSGLASLAYDPVSATYFGVNLDDHRLVSFDLDLPSARAIGPYGVSSVVTLALDTISGFFYGAAGDPSILYRIDPSTGAATALGPTFTDRRPALTFDSNSDTLYGYDYSRGNLLRMNRRNGFGAVVGRLGVDVDTIAFDTTTNTLLATASLDLLRIDPETFAWEVLGELPIRPTALAFNSAEGMLYGLPAHGALHKIDPQTLAVAHLWSTGLFDLRGLAIDATDGRIFGSDQSMPYLFELVPNRVESSVEALVGCERLNQEIVFDVAGDTILGICDSARAWVAIDASSGRTGATGSFHFSSIDGLAADPATETLYVSGFDQTGGSDGIFRVDRARNVVEPLGDLSGDAYGCELAFEAETGILYCAARATGALLAIDSKTGASTSVGTITFQSTPLTWFHDLAYDPHRALLYTLGSSADALFWISPATGRAGLETTLDRGPIRSLAIDPVRGTLYAMHEDYLATIDRTSGAVRPIAPAREWYVLGLASDEIGGVVYAAVSEGNNPYRLLTLDAPTGRPLDVVELDCDCLALAYDETNDVLYGGCRTLHTIDPTTGACSPVAEVDSVQIVGLAFDQSSGDLYATSGFGFQYDLFRIDLSASALEEVGSLGAVRSLGHDRGTGRLYGLEASTQHVFEIDKQTAEVIETDRGSLSPILTLDFFVGDCDRNGTPDACDPDCDRDRFPDACQVATCPPGETTCRDCNGNSVPDACAGSLLGDYDDDGRVSLSDHGPFTGCHFGPTLSPELADCSELCLIVFDHDGDDDVDLADAAVQLRSFSP